jgi:hypothetical protein
MEKGEIMNLKKALALSVEHLLKSSLIQADFNDAVVDDLKVHRERLARLEALIDLHEERFKAQIKKGK